MKRILLSLFATLIIGNVAKGQEGYTIGTVDLPQGREAELQVAYNFEARDCKGLQFNIDLPEGLEFVKKNGKIEYAQGFYSEDGIKVGIVDGSLLVTWGSTNNVAIHRKTGILLALKIKATGSPAVGDEFTCKLKNAIRTLPNGQSSNLDPCEFKVKITDPIGETIIIDENSLFAPSIGEKKNVLVKRTFKANKWNTLCLPFAMTSDQIKSAFGEDAQIAEFTSWTYDETSGINIDFKSVESTTQGKPYIIKVSSPINQFQLNGVNIIRSVSPTEVYGDKGTGTMQGYYKLSTLQEKDIFLQNGFFYYATLGQTIKGLRASFKFIDWGDEPMAMTRASITVNGKSIGDDSGNTTGIDSKEYLSEKSGKVYSLTGKYMGEKDALKSLPKGVYIVDGCKVINK